MTLSILLYRLYHSKLIVISKLSNCLPEPAGPWQGKKSPFVARCGGAEETGESGDVAGESWKTGDWDTAAETGIAGATGGANEDTASGVTKREE